MSQLERVEKPESCGLPIVPCRCCGSPAKLLAFDRRGEPMVSCSTPGCSGHWAAGPRRR